MQQHETELDTSGIDVAVVTFETREAATRYRRETACPWPVLIDASRGVYTACGMGRLGVWAVYGPRSWWGYIRLLLRGRRLHRPTGDVHVTGGDLLVDPRGTVRLHHVGRRPVDRPPVAALLEVVREGSRGEGDGGA